MRSVGAGMMVVAVIFAAFAIGAIPFHYWETLLVDSFLAAVFATVGIWLWRKSAR